MIATNCYHCGIAFDPKIIQIRTELELYGPRLCDPCERSPAFLIGEYSDGAKKWSHPPHCPAWRRVREEFIGFDGCESCHGQGRIWISRSGPIGGSYTVQCEPCIDRHRPDWAAEREISSLRAELDGLAKKYSGRKFNKVDPEQYINTPDFKRFQEGMKRLWEIRIPPAPELVVSLK